MTTEPIQPPEDVVPENFLGLFKDDPGVFTLKQGEDLFKKGDLGQHMYVLKFGELQVIDGNHVFETVSLGGIVGEMALMGNEPRSATVRATRDCEIVPIDERRFLFLVQQTPFFALRVMRLMSSRLKRMNERVVSLPE